MLALNQYLAYNSADSVCQVLTPEIRCGSALPRSAASDLIEVLMLKLKLVIVVSFTVLLLALTGCRGMVAPPEATTLTVMTYNVYVGSSAEELLATMNQAEIPGKVAELYGNVMQSDFPARAAAIARIVKESEPHVIGLQEISLIRKQDSADSLVNPLPNAALDFLAVLQDALQAEGLSYAVAGKVENVDIEMPMLTPTGLVDVRLTDYDVILARSDVVVTNPMAATYQTALPIAHLGIRVPRGYVAVDATVGDVTYRVVNTHLEAFYQLPRVAQMQELVASLSDVTSPMILLGDFNTAAPEGAAYQFSVGAGSADVWQADSEGTGNTCCQDADLINEESDLSTRIDQIFTKGLTLRDGAAIRTATVGDNAEDKTPGGLWPSDHAGVVAHLPVE